LIANIPRLGIDTLQTTKHCYITIMGSKVESAPLGSEFTQKVIQSMGPNTPPRLREIMSSLIKHLHEFTIETQLTTDEWMLGVNAINLAGQMSDDKRNEGQLMCDVLGIES
jgi:catechol 1,2-dioxygenase